MRSSFLLKIARNEIVPSEGRAAWLDKWGKIGKEVEVSASAELCDWEGAPGIEIDADGAILDRHSWVDPDTLAAIRKQIIARLRVDPTNVLDFDATEILRALKAEIAAKQSAAAAKKQAEDEARLRAVQRIHSLTADDVMTSSGKILESIRQEEDDRVRQVARFALTDSSLRADINEDCTDWIDAIRSEAKRRADVAEQAASASKAARAAERRAWVLEHPEGLPTRIVRAANDGLDVVSVLRTFALEQIDAALDEADLEHVTTYGVEDDGRVPTERAYEIHDALVELLPELHSAAKVPAHITIDGFKRVDVSDQNSKTVWRSAIRLSIAMPMLGVDTARSILTEPLAWPADDSDADDEDEEL